MNIPSNTYVMRDQVRGLVSSLSSAHPHRRGLSDRCRRLLEVGTLAVASLLYSFVLFWQF